MTAASSRERRIAGPRIRYILTGQRGAVEYATKCGYPLTISYHCPQIPAGTRPLVCDILPGGSCYGDGTVAAARDLHARWLAQARTRRSSGATWKTGTPGGREPPPGAVRHRAGGCPVTAEPGPPRLTAAGRT